MGNHSRRGIITNFQLFTLIVNSMIATGIFTIARTTAEAAGRGFLIAIPLAGVFSLLQLAGMYLLGARFPEQSPAEYAPEILGKFFGYTFLLGYFVISLGLAIVVPRNFWLILVSWVQENTPQYAMMIPLALACWNVARRGVVVLSRMSEILFALSIPMFLIMAAPHTTFDFDNLRPILDKTPLDVLKGVLPAYFSMTGFDILLFVYPFTRRKKAFGIAGWGVMGVAVFYTVVSIMTVGTIGLELTLINTWPLQQYLNHFSFAFLERIDVVILIAWTIQVIMTITIPLYIAGACLRGVFPKLNSRRATDVCMLFLLVGILAPIRVPMQMQIQNIYSLAALGYVGLLPWALWLIALLRKKGVQSDAKQPDAA